MSYLCGDRLAKPHGLFALPKSWLVILSEALSFRRPQKDKCRDTKAMRYAIVIEQSNNGFCATAPDLPGFMKTGASIDEIEANIHDAIVHHLDALCEDGRQIPAPTAVVEYCELAA